MNVWVTLVMVLVVIAVLGYVVFFFEWEVCDSCGGVGTFITKCRKCGGDGKLTLLEKIRWNAEH